MNVPFDTRSVALRQFAMLSSAKHKLIVTNNLTYSTIAVSELQIEFTLPASLVGSTSNASEATGSVAGGAAGGWGRLGGGLRGRPGEDRKNLHANTTAMAKPATAPKDPALCKTGTGPHGQLGLGGPAARGSGARKRRLPCAGIEAPRGP